MDDQQGAAAYFGTALEAAREARDAPLAAYLIGSAACQPPYRENPAERLHKLLGRTAELVHATPSTQVWLAAKEADAHAMLGDLRGCAGALDRAEAALGRVEREDRSRRPRFSAIDRTWLDGERGASLARLGRTAEARAILQPVLASLGPTSERDRLWLFTALASTYVQDEEPEEACRVARAALDRASRMQLEPVLKVVHGLSKELRTYRTSLAVRELDEQLRSLAGTRTAV